MRSELSNSVALKKLASPQSDHALNELHQLWMNVQKRTFFYHESAVAAFFRYLVLSDGSREDKTAVATLRLLKLTVRHALELQDVLQEGLENTPSAKWTGIVPQLFSRLNHPVAVVRGRISDLLCRLAEDFPNLIIFPAVVGAGEAEAVSEVSKLLTAVVDNEEDSQDSQATAESVESTGQVATLQGAYSRIVDAMRKVNEAGVEQVRI